MLNCLNRPIGQRLPDKVAAKILRIKRAKLVRVDLERLPVVLVPAVEALLPVPEEEVALLPVPEEEEALLLIPEAVTVVPVPVVDEADDFAYHAQASIVQLELMLNFEQVGHTRPGSRIRREGGNWAPEADGWVPPVDPQLAELVMGPLQVPNGNCGGGHGKAVMMRGCQLGQVVGPKEAPKGSRLARRMLNEAGEAVGLACVCGKFYPVAEGRNLTDRGSRC